MKLEFYVLIQKVNIPLEYRKEKYDYVAKHWQEHCGSPVRPSGIMSYWQTTNEYYLDMEGALPVKVEVPDVVIEKMPFRKDWNILDLPRNEFEDIFKGNAQFEALIDAFFLKYARDSATQKEKNTEERYNPAFYKNLPSLHKSYEGPVFMFKKAYQTIIANEMIGTHIGREHPMLVSPNGKLNYIKLYAKPTYLRGIF